jgi:hypothetical protein
MSNRPETRLETHNRYTMMELDAEANRSLPASSDLRRY